MPDLNAKPDPSARRKRGRKRLLDPETERERLLEAGLRLLGKDRITLEAVLAEAGVSTRAFYRQFESLAAFVVAVRLEETLRLSVRLANLTESASGPLEALEVFVDDLLAIGYQKRRAGRASAIRQLDRSTDLRSDSVAVLSLPLERSIVRGIDEGIFVSPHPAVDASTICSILLDFVGEAGTERQRLDLPGARAQVLRFALAALTTSSVNESCR